MKTVDDILADDLLAELSKEIASYEAIIDELQKENYILSSRKEKTEKEDTGRVKELEIKLATSEKEVVALKARIADMEVKLAVDMSGTGPTRKFE